MIEQHRMLTSFDNGRRNALDQPDGVQNERFVVGLQVCISPLFADGRLETTLPTRSCMFSAPWI